MTGALFAPVTLAAAVPEAHVSAQMIRQLSSAVSNDQRFDDHFEAEVWMTDMNRRLSRYLVDPHQRLALLESIQRESRRASLDLQLVLSVIDVESRFMPEARSSAGAQGLMQVMPFWKKEIGRESDDLFDPDTNLRYGCTILAWYLKVEKGDVTRALARYNGSLGKTRYPEQVMTSWDSRWWVDS
ncbi:lytic transglycosylase domain-containing protein [Kushneria marisflavi]|nr:transglycosylase SLT domain-containing protein [Kushneria marisflavi]RKD86796.1 transglycosylase-like protein with SLT domain [Kushneria marisflavi]